MASCMSVIRLCLPKLKTSNLATPQRRGHYQRLLLRHERQVSAARTYSTRQAVAAASNASQPRLDSRRLMLPISTFVTHSKQHV